MTYLELAHVRKAYAEHTVVHDFSLTVQAGEFITFLGPSGCGKTTVLRMIAGLETAQTGRIVLQGQDITHTPTNQRHVGMVFQSYALFPNLTVAQNVGFGLRVAGVAARAQQQRVAEMLELVELSTLGTRYPWQLSGGQQQRVALARALANQPRVLLLDEPLSALDAKIRASLREELRSLQRRLGLTTVFVTHDQEEALSLSDRVVVMNAGRIEQVGDPATIYNQPASEFVAQFVGNLNTLSAKVLNARQGLVQVGEQVLRTSQALVGWAPGAVCGVSFRPEAARLVSADAHPVTPIDAPFADTHNTVQVVVQDRSFLGALVRLDVRLDPPTGASVLPQTWCVSLFNEPHLRLPAVGERVCVHLPPPSLWVSANPGANRTTGPVAA
ncbi:MAG: ABC transporter ATP-binding protein [Rhodoferax sp.]|nr:ABC transporter ATP-binding protein [Rhodoferax sp.]